MVRTLPALGLYGGLALTVGVMGCAVAYSPASPHARVGDKNCFRPLEQYCGDKPCPTYAESVDWVTKCVAGHCIGSEWGTCGTFTYTSHGDGYGGAIRYFGQDGELVAATTWTDYLQGRRCPGWTHYGPRMLCEKAAVQELRRPVR